MFETMRKGDKVDSPVPVMKDCNAPQCPTTLPHATWPVCINCFRRSMAVMCKLQRVIRNFPCAYQVFQAFKFRARSTTSIAGLLFFSLIQKLQVKLSLYSCMPWCGNPFRAQGVRTNKYITYAKKITTHGRYCSHRAMSGLQPVTLQCCLTCKIFPWEKTCANSYD